MELLPSDIMPIVNHAWKKSFGNLSNTRKAIYHRGWYPLNRNLLLDKDLRETMTSEDKEEENKSELFPSVRYKHLKEMQALKIKNLSVGVFKCLKA